MLAATGIGELETAHSGETTPARVSFCVKTTETFKSAQWLDADNRVTRVFGDTAADADDEAQAVAESTDLKFVGPATAAVIDAAEFDGQAIADREVSFRMLVDAGVNPGVAAKIRRWHSLSWTFESGDDLGRRSEQIRHLQDDERAWVASSYGAGDEADADASSPVQPAATEDEWVASATDDRSPEIDAADASDDDFAAEASWVDKSGEREPSSSPTTADGSGDPLAAEAAWRERSKPTPLTTIDDIDDDDAATLEEAGVASIRSLATADPELLADVTGLPAERVESWHERASELAD